MRSPCTTAFDPGTGKGIGLQTGDPAAFTAFEELTEAFGKQLKHFIDIKVRGNNTIHSIFANHMPAPFLSLLIDDCIANGKDYNAGGARYNTTYIQGVGLGSVTDSLTALRYHVFDKKTVSMAGMLRALENDFEDFDELRVELVHNTPKYGNDDDYADDQARLVFEMYYDCVNGRPTSVGGMHRINMLPTTCHVYFGSVIGALPDGRKAKEPLSEGISPFQGADSKGPTAVLKSAAKIDHIRTGGTLLNQKFTPSFFEDEESITETDCADPQLFQDGRAPYPVQCRFSRYPPRRTETPGKIPRPDRTGGGIQRLLQRSRGGSAERDHPENGTFRAVIEFRHKVAR